MAPSTGQKRKPTNSGGRAAATKKTRNDKPTTKKLPRPPPAFRKAPPNKPDIEMTTEVSACTSVAIMLGPDEKKDHSEKMIACANLAIDVCGYQPNDVCLPMSKKEIMQLNKQLLENDYKPLDFQINDNGKQGAMRLHVKQAWETFQKTHLKQHGSQLALQGGKVTEPPSWETVQKLWSQFAKVCRHVWMTNTHLSKDDAAKLGNMIVSYMIPSENAFNKTFFPKYNRQLRFEMALDSLRLFEADHLTGHITADQNEKSVEHIQAILGHLYLKKGGQPRQVLARLQDWYKTMDEATWKESFLITTVQDRCDVLFSDYAWIMKLEMDETHPEKEKREEASRKAARKLEREAKKAAKNNVASKATKTPDTDKDAKTEEETNASAADKAKPEEDTNASAADKAKLTEDPNKSETNKATTKPTEEKAKSTEDPNKSETDKASTKPTEEKAKPTEDSNKSETDKASTKPTEEKAKPTEDPNKSDTDIATTKPTEDKATPSVFKAGTKKVMHMFFGTSESSKTPKDDSPEVLAVVKEAAKPSPEPPETPKDDTPEVLAVVDSAKPPPEENPKTPEPKVCDEPSELPKEVTPEVTKDKNVSSTTVEAKKPGIKFNKTISKTFHFDPNDSPICFDVWRLKIIVNDEVFNARDATIKIEKNMEPPSPMEMKNLLSLDDMVEVESKITTTRQSLVSSSFRESKLRGKVPAKKVERTCTRSLQKNGLMSRHINFRRCSRLSTH